MTAPRASRPLRPLNVYVAPGSAAERKYQSLAGIPGSKPDQLAPGLPATPAHDLHYHGGKTIINLAFANFYVGADAWKQPDVQNIDRALSAAMADPSLNNVMAQYFSAVATTRFIGSQELPGPAPANISQGDVEQLVTTLDGQHKFDGFDATSTVINFMLPSGTVLTDAPTPTTAQRPAGHVSLTDTPIGEADSLHGLGGYHGSVALANKTIYYAVGVYSEIVNGQENGIAVFDAPWKNVVATFYHELNEARTDPDVEQVINGGSASLLGWTSNQGEECGDFPVFEANPLTLVFREVPVAVGGTVPIQYMYSNAVHGPEGPVAAPEPPSPQLRAAPSVADAGPRIGP